MNAGGEQSAGARLDKTWLIIALVIGAIALGLAWQAWRPREAVVTIARVERLSGEAALDGRFPWSDPVRLAPGAQIEGGHTIRTPASGSVLLALTETLHVRLAPDTAAQFVSGDEIELEYGKIYVDAVPGGTSTLRLVTSHGELAHVGTQYEVLSRQRVFEVAVREGQIRLTRTSKTPALIEAGQALVIDAAGNEQRRLVATTDARWSWLAATPMPIAIEGMELTEFLSWYERETGRDVQFADSGVEQASREIRLHGSVDALPPEAALSMVVASSNLLADLDARSVQLRAPPPPPADEPS